MMNIEKLQTAIDRKIGSVFLDDEDVKALLLIEEAARMWLNPNIEAVVAVLWGVHETPFDAEALARKAVAAASTPPEDKQ